MEEQQTIQSPKRSNLLAFQVAITFALYTILLIFVTNLLGIGVKGKDTPVWQTVLSTILTYGPFIVAIYYTENKFKKDLGGYITFGKAFSAGFKVAAYSGLFIGILMVLYYTVIDPAALRHIIDLQIQAVGDNEKAIESIESMSKYMWLFIAFGSAVTYSISGLIISLICAAFVKKEVDFR